MNDDASAARDFDTDMATIDQYVAATVEAKNKIATAYLSAVDNFQATIQSASPGDAKPDILGTILKAGLKEAVKAAVGEEAGPLVDIADAVNEEIDRAAKAAADLAGAEWIKSARTAIANAYTQDQTGAALRAKIVAEYNNNDEGGRGGYIGGIENELQAMQSVQAPKEEVVEVALYRAWINQNFNGDCIDGAGVIYIQFDADGSPSSATVIAPLGDKIAGALNDRMAVAGVRRLMDLDVVKKVCKGDDCMCFEGNNVVRKAASSDDTQSFLTSADSWNQFKTFTT
jgi:hypothetical protein